MDLSREEGEISDTENEVVYNPVLRPALPQYRTTRQSVLSSDESNDSSYDSDSDGPCLPKRRKFDKTMEITGSGGNATGAQGRFKKRNNIWANVLQEEGLTQEIGSVGLKYVALHRGVESYDFTKARTKPDSEKEEGETDSSSETEEPLPQVEKQFDWEEEKNELAKRLMRKRRFLQISPKPKADLYPLELPNIEVDPTWTDEQLGITLAQCLSESKPELITRVVEALGQEAALKLYKRTQEIEKTGGILVKNGSRRRTPGGLYLYLVKGTEGVNKELLQKIFPPEEVKASHQWGKRKRAMRRRKRLDGNTKENHKADMGPSEDLLSDGVAGPKCPGSTPVSSPQGSDNEVDGMKPEVQQHSARSCRTGAFLTHPDHSVIREHCESHKTLPNLTDLKLITVPRNDLRIEKALHIHKKEMDFPLTPVSPSYCPSSQSPPRLVYISTFPKYDLAAAYGPVSECLPSSSRPFTPHDTIDSDLPESCSEVIHSGKESSSAGALDSMETV